LHCFPAKENDVIYAVTVSIDIQTLDPTLPAKLMGAPFCTAGAARRIPGGVLVFQAAAINDTPGEASVYRFIAQFGSLHGASAVGNWLFAQLHNCAVALSLAGNPVPVDHRTIIRGLRQVS
jgi:hypothetical protein